MGEMKEAFEEEVDLVEGLLTEAVREVRQEQPAISVANAKLAALPRTLVRYVKYSNKAAYEEILETVEQLKKELQDVRESGKQGTGSKKPKSTSAKPRG